ncbi:hypothetical protein [Streptomyces sp. P9-A2]|uniref:hypothetical protein n=1 Tax=Streptomyces sp. P9-A2 TaxID=3072284 RepID=UPI002FCC6A07
MTGVSRGIGRSTAGRRLADVALGATGAPTGSYADRGRVARSSQEPYDPRREDELRYAAERLTAPTAVVTEPMWTEAMPTEATPPRRT